MSKRIAIVTHASQMEGAERSLLAVMDYLKNQRGWSLIVAVCMEGDFTLALAKMDIPFQKYRYQWWQSNADVIDPKWSGNNIATAVEMAAVFSDFAADVVYTNTSVVGVGALVAMKMKKPHIWHIRELASGHIFDKHRKAMPAIGSFMAATTNQFVFNSQACLDDWNPLLGNAINSDVVYNQMEVLPRLFKGPDHSEFIMAVVGSVLPIKNQGALIEALGQLVQLYPDRPISLKIIGPIRNPEYHQALMSQAEDLNIANRINWVGFLANPWEAVVGVDLLVIPGNKEGFGRVCAEALMQEIPVLAAAGGGTNELVIHGETGFLYDPESDSLTNAIASLIDNAELRNSCVAKGRKHVLNLTLSVNTFERLEVFLSDVILMDPSKADLKVILKPYRLPSVFFGLLKKSVKRMIGRK